MLLHLRFIRVGALYASASSVYRAGAPYCAAVVADDVAIAESLPFNSSASPLEIVPSVVVSSEMNV